MDYEYLGERMADGGVFGLYRKCGGAYEKYDVSSDSWISSGEARDAFHGDVVCKRMTEEGVNSEIAEKKKNYEIYLQKNGTK